MVPGSPRPLHVGDCCLHQEERTAQVHGDVLVEQSGGGVQHGASGGQSGCVDQAVDATVPVDGRRHGGLSLGHVADVCADEEGIGADAPELSRNLVAVVGVAAGQHQRGTFAGGGPGDPGAEALGPATDQQHLPGQQVLHVDSIALFVRLAACSQPGLATAAGRWPVSTSRTPCAASRNVVALACRLIPIR
jgi:hypothetical protein